ncbi:hypothetical protein V2J09_008312 [Rumex salicifolius]
MGSLILPKSTCKEIDKNTRAFIWGSTRERRKMHLVGWNQVCKSKAAGGLGIKKMTTLNQALLGKLSWRFLTQCDSLWASVLRAKYVRPSEAIQNHPSRIWKGIQSGVQNVVLKGCRWNLGDGNTIRFWRDIWILDEPLFESTTFPITDDQLDSTVRDYWHEGGGWRWDLLTPFLPTDILFRLAAVGVLENESRQDVQDDLRWGLSSDGNFSVKSAYDLITGGNGDTEVDSDIYRAIWKLHVPERVRCFIWLALRGAVMTNEERRRRHLSGNDCCDCCPMGLPED